MDLKIKRELVKVRNAVKRKLQALKEGALQEQVLLRKSYQPLTEPLEELAKGFQNIGNVVKTETKEEVPVTPKQKRFLPPSTQASVTLPTETSELSTLLPVTEPDEDAAYEYTREQVRQLSNQPGFQEFLESYDELPRYYVEGMITDTGDTYENTNNVRYDFVENKFFIGKWEMGIEGKDIIVRGVRYPGTTGLYELLLKKEPTGYKQEDLTNFKDILERTRPDNPQTYITALIHDTVGIFDTQYGVRYNPDSGKYFIGDSEVKIEGQNLTVKQKRYKITHGLLELLFKKEPIGYSEDDLPKYRDIVYRTNAHKVGYKSTAQIAGNKGKKYQLIKKLMSGPLFQSSPITSTPKKSPSGRGLWLEVNDKPVELVYYDDPNELCDRLKLLVASQEGGNTGHTNEIVSIIEELRECGIIE